MAAKRLLQAIKDDKLETVRQIVLNEYKPNLEYDDTIVRYVCKKGDTELLDLLLKDPYCFIDALDGQALRNACKHGHLPIVERLHTYGANLHILEDKPLAIAAGNGYTRIVKFLIKNGAKADACNNRAMKWAKEKRHQDVIDLLKYYGCPDS